MAKKLNDERMKSVFIQSCRTEGTGSWSPLGIQLPLDLWFQLLAFKRFPNDRAKNQPNRD
jgi:hypothetical protein